MEMTERLGGASEELEIARPMGVPQEGAVRGQRVEMSRWQWHPSIAARVRAAFGGTKPVPLVSVRNGRAERPTWRDKLRAAVGIGVEFRVVRTEEGRWVGVVCEWERSPRTLDEIAVMIGRWWGE